MFSSIKAKRNWRSTNMTDLDLEIDRRVKQMNITQIKCELDTPNFKSFFCERKEQRLTYSFRIMFSPSFITVNGDCGNLILSLHSENSLDWLCKKVKNINNVINSIAEEMESFGKEYDAQKAKDFLYKMINQKKQDCYDFYEIETSELEKYEQKCHEFIDKCDDFNSIDEACHEFYNFLCEINEESFFDLESFSPFKWDDYALNRFAQLRAFVLLYSQQTQTK